MLPGERCYLATTGVSQLWDLNKRILFLGPWCLAQRKNSLLVDGKSYFVVPSPWKPAERIKEAAEYTQHLYNEALLILSEKLNILHGVSYPFQYWQILLGPWLLHFIGILYERYERIKNALELFPDFYTHILSEETYPLASCDTYDFLSLTGKVSDDWYNLKLFSLCISNLCPEKAVAAGYELILPEKTQAPLISYRRKILRRLKRISDTFSTSRVILSDMYRLSYAEMLRLELRLNIRIQDLPRVKKPPCAESNFSDSRQQLAFDKGTSDNFSGLLYRTIPQAIPLAFVEHYKTYKNAVKVGCSVKIVGSAVGWYFNEEFKFFAAEAFLQGAKVVEFQHGGGYGMSLSVPSEFMALEKDIFYTWGWENGMKSRTKPLPSPYLSRLKNSAQPKAEEFLFIGTSTHRYISMLCNYLLPDDIPKYFNDKKIFFAALKKETRGKITYRPYPEVGWNEIDTVSQFFPGIKFFQDGILVDRMKKAKLVIIDHLSTTFLEALTINVPCVLFWDHQVNALRAEAEQYFEFLRKAGILYKTPQDAARKVDEICENPLAWWMTEEIQELKSKFCYHFALTSDDWFSVWAEEFGVAYENR